MTDWLTRPLKNRYASYLSLPSVLLPGLVDTSRTLQSLDLHPKWCRIVHSRFSSSCCPVWGNLTHLRLVASSSGGSVVSCTTIAVPLMDTDRRHSPMRYLSSSRRSYHFYPVPPVVAKLMCPALILVQSLTKTSLSASVLNQAAIESVCNGADSAPGMGEELIPVAAHIYSLIMLSVVFPKAVYWGPYYLLFTSMIFLTFLRAPL